ncbi:universal stress protein [Hymenobacter sp. BT730]|uniref:universal stress protein n=1 Tax=Hymenobacter sp. BT730 TaxID=3063332 RepID=UPI0026E11111|nr:universal stress protein [Hymenobacter sp. BT730]
MSFTFIVLTNFYPAANQAMQYAAGLAAKLQAQLVLLHVKRASLFDPYVFAGENWRKAELDAEAPTAEAMQELVARLPVPATVEMATDLLPAMAHSLMARYHPALFVLGRPAEAVASGDQVSGAALDLLRAAHFPLLLVPVGTTAAAPPHQVLIAADTESFGLEEEGQFAQQLLSSLQCPATVAHISEMEDDDACAMALQAVHNSGLVAGNQQVELRCFQNSHTAAGILEAAQATQAGLILLIARQRSYLGELFHRSVTAQVLQHTPVPVLLLPAVEMPVSDTAAAFQRQQAGTEADDLMF